MCLSRTVYQMCSDFDRKTRIFITPALDAPLKVLPSEFCFELKNQTDGPTRGRKMFDDMCIPLDTLSHRDGQTDGQKCRINVVRYTDAR